MTDAGSVATTDRARLEEVNDGRVEGASPCRRLSPAPDLADIRFAAVPGGGCSAESSSCLARCCGWPEQGTGWSPFHSPLTGHGGGLAMIPKGAVGRSELDPRGPQAPLSSDPEPCDRGDAKSSRVTVSDGTPGPWRMARGSGSRRARCGIAIGELPRTALWAPAADYIRALLLESAAIRDDRHPAANETEGDHLVITKPYVGLRY